RARRLRASAGNTSRGPRRSRTPRASDPGRLRRKERADGGGRRCPRAPRGSGWPRRGRGRLEGARMKWSRRHVLDTDDWSRDEIVMRHASSGAPYFVAERTEAAVINAGDGWHAHPTQGLLDAYTLRDALGDLDGKRIVVVGDVLHSRVARSDMNTLLPLGARVTLSGPPTLIPTAWRCGQLPPGVTYESDLDKALEGADAVIALRLQSERQESGLLPSLREYSRVWGLTGDRVGRMRPGAPVMHPGPMNEGVEIDAAVAHGSRSLIEKQVTNGVAVRMALLYLLAATQPLEER